MTLNTRMHTSRMLTARLLPVSQHALPQGTGGVPAEGVYLPRVVYLPGRGTWLGGTCPGGVPAWGYLPRGCTYPGTLPPQTEFLIHASENITLPQTSFVGGNNDQMCRIQFAVSRGERPVL